MAKIIPKTNLAWEYRIAWDGDIKHDDQGLCDHFIKSGEVYYMNNMGETYCCECMAWMLFNQLADVEEEETVGK